MRKTFFIMCVLILLAICGCAQKSKQSKGDQGTTLITETTSKEQLYTAYNIWIMKFWNMKCINYKNRNNILPAGTKVQHVGIGKNRDEMWPHIYFETDEGERSFQIGFVNRWHPGKTIQDYKNYMFTNKNFKQLTEGLSELEIDAIRRGTVVNGMSKKAVLISYGYPPEHRTSSLKNQTWIYWKNVFGTFNVCFDENDRTVRCP